MSATTTTETSLFDRAVIAIEAHTHGVAAAIVRDITARAIDRAIATTRAR